ncbi:hypothetical protein O3M35_005369 [Rhynocoris fuscipes]|uniref:FAM234A/B beta-propeller domain-containing protein n=1 Tax=Rhynocoris fuscipes TaxID=488301 RepID=A0AAW1DIG1_9HEMI
MAFDGRTGEILWQYWTRKDVLFVDCSANINADKTNDCLLSGKGGVLCSIDGKSGNLIWEVEKSRDLYTIDIYSAQYISDFDGDGYSDVLVAHTSDDTGLLIVLSGRNGNTIGEIQSPKQEGLYTVPRVIVTIDGTYMVIFATGQPNIDTGGALYAVPLHSIALSDEKRCTEIWRDYKAGVSSGIVLVDMNNDGMDDIVVTSGNKLSIINGNNFSLLWNISSDREINEDISKQILIGPTPAYFDDDLIPDFLINYLIGPAFPMYYYSQIWVAGGRNGESLLDDPMIGAGDITAPGITISFTGNGNDMFLFWITSCDTDAEAQKMPFILSRESTMHERSHADFCKLRFNKTSVTQLYALNQHIKPPGLLIYSSKNNWDIEHNTTLIPDIKQEDTISRTWYKTSKPNKIKNKQQSDVTSYFGYSQDSVEDPSVTNFQKYPEGLNEQPESPIRIRPSLGINLGELAMDYEQLFPQEIEPPADINVDVNKGRDERANLKKVVKRHLNKNIHGESLARSSVTATLAKPLSGNGIDIIFATHWEIPSSRVHILTERDQICIQKKIDSIEMQSTLSEIELEEVKRDAERECLPRLDTEKLGAGQLTMYRVNLKCKGCGELSVNEQCSVPLPLDMQSYSHRACNVYFKKKQNLYYGSK